MSSVLAIVSKASFDKMVPKGIALGAVVDTSQYVSNNKTFDGLVRGGAIFLVTVRPPDEKLWLVGILENPTKKKDTWSAAANEVPLTDVTSAIKALRFESGSGIKAKKGTLGMSLQTPRALTERDVTLLRGMVSSKGSSKVHASAAYTKAVDAVVHQPKKPKPATSPGRAKKKLKQKALFLHNAALLAAVLDAPESDQPRLVYADYLLERDDPRGELITVQCALGTATGEARERLVERERELLADHGRAWSEAVTKEGKLKFMRGFAHVWKVAPNRLHTCAAAVFAREPIRVVDLSQGDLLNRPPPNMMRAFTCPELSRVHRLELRRITFHRDQFATVAACPYLANLRALDLTYVPLSLVTMAALTSNPTFTKLETLRLVGIKFDLRLVDALARAPFIGTLRSLDLSKSTIGVDGIVALSKTKAFSGLKELLLTDCDLHNATRERKEACVEALVSSAVFAKLDRLAIDQNQLPAEASKRLVTRWGRDHVVV